MQPAAPLLRAVEAAAKATIERYAGRSFDFAEPRGEAALVAADSVSWRVFKNPISLYVGGVAAVLLELAEPRVRTGVWEHTRFREEPLPRMARTALAAMVTVYGPRGAAEAMIAGVSRRHARIEGLTPDGAAYRADEAELLDWVQATASYGFLEAYHAFARRLSEEERDRFYAEAAPAAALYGAAGAPTSRAGQAALFQAMRPRLERSAIVFEFLEIMRRVRGLPAPLTPLRGPLIRAAIDILPGWAREILDLGPAWDLRGWERALIRAAGALADRLPIPGAPPVEACRRMGLPATYLYRRR